MRKLTRDEANKVEQARDQEGGNFIDLVKILGLRPELDFRFTDLRSVDFGAADLKAYDFTGADLRGADFRRANWSEACFRGARVDENTRWARSPPSIHPLCVRPAEALLRSEVRPLIDSILPELRVSDRNTLLFLIRYMAPTGVIDLYEFRQLAFPGEDIGTNTTSFHIFCRFFEKAAASAGLPLRLVIDERIGGSVAWFKLERVWNNVLHGCAFSSSGDVLYAVGDGGSIKHWDWKTGKLTQVSAHDAELLACAISPDGRQLVAGSVDGTLTLWTIEDHVPDGASRLIIRHSQHSAYVSACAFSPDGKWIVSASGDRDLIVWDTESWRTSPSSGSTSFVLSHHSAAGEGCAYSPDGNLIASASRDGTICIWDAIEWKLVRQIEASRQFVTSCGFSHDGALLASTSDDGMVRTWWVATGSPYRALEGHEKRTTACAFSPDQHHLASASDDGTVRIWDVETGMSVNVLRAESSDTDDAGSASIVSCVYSRDGRYLGTISGRGCLRVWDSHTGICLSKSFAKAA